MTISSTEEQKEMFVKAVFRMAYYYTVYSAHGKSIFPYTIHPDVQLYAEECSIQYALMYAVNFATWRSISSVAVGLDVITHPI